MITALSFAVAVVWLASSYSSSASPARTFTVSGEGKVVAIPDTAEFVYSVITEGGVDLTALQKENARKVNLANNFLKENGVEEKDIQTLSYNISPRYQHYKCEKSPCPPPEIVGYSINQSVKVKVRDLSRAGSLLSGVVEQGANSVSNLSFTVDDIEELKNQARIEAIEIAKAKAKAVAKSAGFKLGKLVSLNESFLLPAPPVFFSFREAQVVGAEEGVSLEPGSQEIKVNISLTYAID